MGESRIFRGAAAVAMAGLLGLTAACGSTADDTGVTGTGAAGSTTSTTAPAKKVGAAVTGDGMKGGCDAVHKLFAALDAGDKQTAESLKTKGHDMFNDVAATEATEDMQLATDAAAMASMLEFELPEAQIYQSTLADTYKVDCVARYDAAALPG
jgi:hypothetical protein